MARGEHEDDEAAEARARFDDAYDLLRSGFNMTDGRDRDEMSYEELVAEHETMESLRGDAFLARRGIVSRFHPPAHDHVEVPTGVQDTSRTGRVFAVIGGLMFLGTFFLGWWLIAGGRDDIGLHLQGEEVVEVTTTEGFRCDWRIRVRVVNDTDASISLDRGYVIVDRGRSTARVTGPSRIVAGARGDFAFAVAVDKTDSDRCPGAEEMNHERLYLEFESDGATSRIDRSLRF